MAAKKRTTTKVNKSEVVRNYARENPSARPKAVTAVLNARGYKVSHSYVSSVLYNAKVDAAIEARRQGLGKGVEEAIALIRVAGSVEAASAILKALAAIRVVPGPNGKPPQ